jgi:hypothetical protein
MIAGILDGPVRMVFGAAALAAEPGRSAPKEFT